MDVQEIFNGLMQTPPTSEPTAEQWKKAYFLLFNAITTNFLLIQNEPIEDILITVDKAFSRLLDAQYKAEKILICGEEGLTIRRTEFMIYPPLKRAFERLQTERKKQFDIEQEAYFEEKLAKVPDIDEAEYREEDLDQEILKDLLQIMIEEDETGIKRRFKNLLIDEKNSGGE